MLMATMEQSLAAQSNSFGFTDKDLDDVRR